MNTEKNTLTYAKIKTETERIVSAIATSDEAPLSLFKASIPAGKIAIYSFFIVFVNAVLEFLIHNFREYPNGIVDVIKFLSIYFIACLIVIATSISTVSAYYMIPYNVREDSVLIRVIKRKVKKIIRLNLYIWMVASIICCFWGGGTVLVGFGIPIGFLIGYVLFIIDVSRYKISGVLGVLKSSGAVFKSE